MEVLGRAICARCWAWAKASQRSMGRPRLGLRSCSGAVSSSCSAKRCWSLREVSVRSKIFCWSSWVVSGSGGVGWSLKRAELSREEAMLACKTMPQSRLLA